jgi:TolB-like protein/Tfp pilus assembly protein PilF
MAAVAAVRVEDRIPATGKLLSLATGARFGPYEILSPLGAGGMGEVYRAKDTKLGREVAIKVLPESVSADPEKLKRFEREARALASLNHPNIVTVYSVEEAGDMRLLAMELVEGHTLDLVISTGGLSLSRFFEIAVPLADALSAAHERGIVHRDLKPSNVMLTREGRLKVLDFGLAKLVTADSDPNVTGSPTASRAELTGEGTVFGTVAYMSPEQARGGKVDARSDVFSLGIVLYEMLTGDRPFKGASPLDILSSIVRDSPSPVTEIRADLPPHVGRILRRCLAKDPYDRYQTSRDVLNELRDLQAETSAPARSAPVAAPARGVSGRARADEGFWIAVLPFKSSGDAEMETFADGLGEEITTGLSRFRYLSVVASASAARVKGEGGNERALGDRLGARYVLEGSIRKGGSAVRVSAQLLDARTGAQLWAETYNRDLQASSIFEIQDDVAARIVATVADSYGVLVHSIRSAMRQKDDADLTPAEWQFQYFAYREQITPASYASLKSRLESALERDGRQSDLWASLAQMYVDEYAFGFGGDANSLDRALAAARRAVELDRANQFALVALAQVHFFRQDLASFAPAAERAMALNPLNTDAVGILGLQIVHTGAFERGTAIVRHAMELNPNHAGWMHFAPLWDHFHKGEYEQALERANRVDVPGLFWPYLVMASACGHLGRRAETAAAVRDLLALDPDFAAHARSNIGTWHFASGLMEPILEGLRKAGLAIPENDSSPKLGAAVPTRAPRAESAAASGPIRAEEGFWVAVLPFKYGGTNADITALADGLSEEIVTGLSRFSYLRVIARGSTARYSSESGDVRAIGKQLGARYVMEGSIRQAGTKLRLAVQLVDTVSGTHLWAETYERTFDPESVFELQDDLVPRIVATVADQQGVLPRCMSEALRSKNEDALTPQEAVLRAFSYFGRMNPEEFATLRRILQRAVREAPEQADCWAMLSMIYSTEFADELNVEPDPLDRALAAAQRAVDLAPTQALGHFALAFARFLRKETLSFRAEVERAVALNPMDASGLGILGVLMDFSGEVERGQQMVEAAMRLNPNCPGLVRFGAWIHAYRQGHYGEALETTVRMNMPGFYHVYAARAAALGQLGHREAAQKALQELLALRPDFAAAARREYSKWHDAELVEHMLDGLRKAGLEIAPEGAAPAPVAALARASATDSGAARAEEGFWVAVLPFRHGGTDASLTALAEGLTEDIVTGLSRFSYLRVIARSSTSRYANEAVDVRSAGKELGARYVIEGSLRQAGTKLRIAVQLADTVSGAHLWAESYERAFSAEAVFELQDELVPRIVATVADMNGVLPRSMSEAVRSRDPEQLSPYEAVLRSFGYLERVTPEELASARSALESALRKAPAYADAWAMLAFLCVQEYGQGFNLQPDPLTSGAIAARRAVEAAPSNPLACFSLAQALFFQKEFQSFRNAAERAVALNPMDGNSIAFLGELLVYAGDRERGLALAGRAKQLNPNHPGWYWYADFYDSYRRADYRGALDFVRKANLPGHWGMHAAVAAACAQLGESDAAARALKNLLKLRPDFAAKVRTEFEKWWEPAYVESFLDGLRKAGLEAPSRT